MRKFVCYDESNEKIVSTHRLMRVAMQAAKRHNRHSIYYHVTRVIEDGVVRYFNQAEILEALSLNHK